MRIYAETCRKPWSAAAGPVTLFPLASIEPKGRQNPLMTTESVILYVIFPLAGYLLGSVPFAWLIGKARGVDIRTVGSKNIGATNLGRALGKHYFWYGFLLDFAKGFFPVLIAAQLMHHWNSQGWTISPESTTDPVLYMAAFAGWTPLLT